MNAVDTTHAPRVFAPEPQKWHQRLRKRLGSPDWLDQFSLKFVYWGRRHRKPAFLVTTLVGFGAIRGLIFIVEGPLSGTLVSEYAGHLLAGLIAISLFPALTLFVERHNVFLVMEISARGGGPDLAPNRSFLTENLEQMRDQFQEMLGDGAILTPYQVARWVQWCFETANTNKYVGTDSHVPSEYRDIYAEYLSAHRQFIERLPESESKRLMITYPARLRADRADNPEDNRVFLEWHSSTSEVELDDGSSVETKPVELFQLAPHDSNLLLKNADLSLEALDETDIGFWDGNFVLLFNPLKDAVDPVDGSPTHIRLRLRFKGTTLYKECERFVMLLENEANPLDSDLSIYSSQLSENWKRFAAPELRIKQTVPMIEQVIAQLKKPKSSIRIFDAAAGVGFEAVALLREGYLVQLNEIEETLRNAARHYARENEVLLPEAQFSRSDWLELTKELQEEQFDVVLVLGNSLCHLESEKQLRSALQQFHALLRDGGALICDERNFDYMRKNWDDIKKDPINNFRFNKREDRVMYLGAQVLGAPFEFDGKRFVFEYWNVQLDNNNRFKKEGNDPLGSLSMFAFPRGTMLGALESAGFKEIKVLGDLEPIPTNALSDECDFYTYVAVK
jgi:SAM-dependent methyltransferase